MFCTNAHGTHWMIGTIFVKFSQLILMKIIKIAATRCQFISLKSIKGNLGGGSAPDPAAGTHSAPPDTLAGFRDPTSRGRGVERSKGRVPSPFFLQIYVQASLCPVHLVKCADHG